MWKTKKNLIMPYKILKSLYGGMEKRLVIFEIKRINYIRMIIIFS